MPQTSSPIWFSSSRWMTPIAITCPCLCQGTNSLLSFPTSPTHPLWSQHLRSIWERKQLACDRLRDHFRKYSNKFTPDIYLYFFKLVNDSSGTLTYSHCLQNEAPYRTSEYLKRPQTASEFHGGQLQETSPATGWHTNLSGTRARGWRRPQSAQKQPLCCRNFSPKPHTGSLSLLNTGPVPEYRCRQMAPPKMVRWLLILLLQIKGEHCLAFCTKKMVKS